MRAASLAAAVTAGLLAAASARAEEGRTLSVSPRGPYTSLREALDRARDGDTLLVEGRHAGPLVIDKRLSLIGRGMPVIEGHGLGTVVRITAAGAALRGFLIRGSGDSLDQENSGIAVEAPSVVVEGNRLEDTLFGIYARKAAGSAIRANWIESKDLAVPRRGDAIRVWFSDGIRVEGNTVQRARDVVLWYSADLTVANNHVTRGRYGLHFMYCDDADIHGNRLTDNSVGAFLMYSRRLRLRRNVIAGNRGPSGYGVGLKDMDDALVAENLFVDNRIGAYVDNSPREIDGTLRIEGNVFAANDAGVRLLPLVRRNEYLGNAFVDNQEQVGLTGGGRLEGNTWEGNYWSDYAGYDADRDGRGDLPYRAERLFESLVDRDPKLRLFVYSPAADAVDLAARAFPLVRPQPKLTDPAPLMAAALPVGLSLSLASAGAPGRLLLLSFALAALAVVLMAYPLLPPLGRSAPQQAVAPAGPADRPADAPLVRVEGLTKRFGALVAVDGLSLHVAPGEAVALWGANGAGKTTAIRCLLGLLPHEGSVTIDGLDVSQEGKQARRRVGFVPQELGFHDDLSVTETLRFYARLKKSSLAPIPDLLARLGLTEHAAKAVRELSGGLKQRLALAVALLGDPPLLVLDEPTANLDAAARSALLALLDDLKAQGKALVFSSHRLEEVATLGDRALVLERGQLVSDLAAAHLAQHLGLRSTLHVAVAEAQVEPAATLLEAEGFTAIRAGLGLSIDVDPDDKARPIALLAQAGIRLHDFELSRRTAGKEARSTS